MCCFDWKILLQKRLCKTSLGLCYVNSPDENSGTKWQIDKAGNQNKKSPETGQNLYNLPKINSRSFEIVCF